MTASEAAAAGRPPLRVLHVVPDLNVGGAERHVSVVFPRLDPARFLPSVICIGEEGTLFPTLQTAGVEARALHRSKGQGPLAVMELVREMRRWRPDVVITRGYSAEVLGRIAATAAGVRHQVVWVHNNGTVNPRGRMRRVLDRVLDPVTSAYFGVAHGQLDYLTNELGYPRDKIQIIYNGVDPAEHPYPPDRAGDAQLRAELGIAPEDRVLGIVAVLRPEKDHAVFLRAARLIHDRLPTARFLVVGDGPLRPELEQLAADLGIAERVVFTGQRSDVPRLLRLMDVFSLTSYTVEAFPFALLEAMANGLPAVCTAVGGVPELIDEGVTGHVVPPRDPSALAERVLALLESPGATKRMGAAARARLEERFTIQQSVEATEAALEQTAGRRAARLL